MASKKKLLQAAAGSAGAEALDVDDVFSTYLYEGNSTSSQTIANGIDLSGEGGLVIGANRSVSTGLYWFDTEQGITKYLTSQNANAAGTNPSGYDVTSFNSNGFSVGQTYTGAFNRNGDDIVSWTWRKAPKFFTCLTYSGNGATRTISHNLGSDVGMLIVKRTDASAPWAVWHRQLNGGTNSGQYYLQLNSTNAEAASSPYWNNTAPTSTEFTVSSDGHVNNASGTYVAYLFAHNNGDGEFGPDSDQDVVKAGSFTKTDTGGTNFIEVNLGFEVQWLLTKTTSESGNWEIWDVQRGLSYSGNQLLNANLSSAESNYPTVFRPTPNGFEYTDNNAASYIYMAIRRGPLAEPESATDVFHVNNYSGNSNSNLYNTGFNVDMNLHRKASNTSDTFNLARLIGSNNLYTNTTGSEDSNTPKFFEPSNVLNLKDNWWGTQNDIISWSWKRAPSYFDVVAYKGTGSNRTVSHNLGVAPEMIWVKARDLVEDWNVYHSALGNQAYLKLNTTNQVVTSNTNRWNSTSPTASVFSLGTTDGVNKNSYNYIAYLFATVAGVSKVGSYTSNGAQQNIDCGFSSGARFVLIKRTSGTGGWYVFDSERGITASNDPYLQLQSTAAEGTDNDVDIEPYSSGFTVNYGNVTINNLTGETYIFYAIA